MPVTRSRENSAVADVERPTNCSFTVNLDEDISNVASTSGRTTRSQTIRNSNRVVDEPTVSDDRRFRAMVAESMSSLREEMTTVISTQFQSMFRELNIARENSSRETLPASPSYRTPHPHEPQNTEKVLNIIRNWRIKFTGHSNNMTVDDFIYRVNVLTVNHLGGDFDLLCLHASSLFEDKALKFYWRYHRQNEENLNWTNITNALKAEFKVDYNDYDILDDIRKRKQKSNEDVDEFLDGISTLTDRLKTPMNDI